MDQVDPEDLVAEAARLEAEAATEIAQAETLDDLARVRARLVGKSGAMKALKKTVGRLPKDSRRSAGGALNATATRIDDLLAGRKDLLGERAGDGEPDPTFDPTLPGTPVPDGSRHPVTLLLDEVRAIFTRLGFDEVSGPEVEDEWHNFDALNISPNHPARSEQDQFYVEGGRLLRSQTSTVQVRIMESRQPPLRIFAPGRVYRPETVDATHLYAFHQVEGLMVGEDVTFQDLKGCLITFVKSLFGPDVQVRFRPSYFPFTEVSAELDVLRSDGSWMEVLGCGMVNPKVFERVGYDAERYTGFAFGVGLERLAMQRWQLGDIRALVENDVRFLAQFR